MTIAFWGSPTMQSGGQNQKWLTSGPRVYITSTVLGSPTLQSGGQNQKWPASGRSSYITLVVSGVPDASEQVTKLEVAHKRI